MAENTNKPKEKFNSIEYFNVFDVNFEKFINSKICGFVCIGNITVLTAFIKKAVSAEKIIIIDEQNVIDVLKQLNIFDNFIFIENSEIGRNGKLPPALDNITFDYIVGYPQFKSKNLKLLQIFYDKLNFSGEISWFGSLNTFITLRLIWHKAYVERIEKIKNVFNNIYSLKQLQNRLVYIFFNTWPTISVGIIKIRKQNTNQKTVDADKFINLPELLKNKIRKIMDFCMENNCLKHSESKTDFALKIPYMHGGEYGSILSKSYISALNTKAKSYFTVYFNSEKERLDFFNFYNRDFGKFLILLWKDNLYAHGDWIPYKWFETDEEAKRFFDLNDNEINTIKNFIFNLTIV